MLLSQEYGFLFVHIPKTAGTSISRALKPLCEARSGTWVKRLMRHVPVKEDIAKVYLPHHATAAWALTKLGEDQFNKLHSFSVVRHPLDRAYSHYQFTRRHGNHHWHKRMMSAGFNDYLEYLASKPSSRRPAQTDFVFGADGQLLVNSILRFETLEADFAALCSRLELPVLSKLGTHNRSLENPQRAEALADQRARKLVADIYATDFAAFGYQV